MPTNAERYAVDTSVAVPALDANHAAHDACRAALVRHRPALAGHAAFEAFSVLTRMPGGLAIDPVSARSALTAAFGRPIGLNSRQAGALFGRLGSIGIVGGAVYDALVAEAARVHGTTLLTRDRRAQRTYDLLGVNHRYVD